MKKKLLYLLLFQVLFLKSAGDLLIQLGDEKNNEWKDSVQCIVALSIPKSGSFLLYKCIHLITGKEPVHAFYASEFTKWENGFVTNHELPTLKAVNAYKDLGIKAIFIYRDPRDQVVSSAHFFKEYLKNPKAVEMSDNILIMDCIKNSCFWWDYVVFHNILSKNLSIGGLYNSLMPWADCAFVYSTTFEKLVGSKGGGSDQDQIHEIMNIAQHLGYHLNKSHAEDIARQLFGRFTFRKGKIGAWKKEFTKEHKTIFNKVAGQLLIDLEYEKNFNWAS